MTEEEAIKKANKILRSVIDTKEKIDELYDLEPFIADYKFGDLTEALIAICPEELLQYT